MELTNATGRRKQSIARVYLKEGQGKLSVNEREFNNYFPIIKTRQIVMKPLQLTNNESKYDIKVNLRGGGISGQAEALSLAISRALIKIDPEHSSVLKENGLLRRDPRRVERKKPGQPKARKKFQFSKR